MFQGCFKEISRVIKGCFNPILRKFHGCDKSISCVFQYSFKGISKVFPRWFNWVFWVSLRWSKDVSSKERCHAKFLEVHFNELGLLISPVHSNILPEIAYDISLSRKFQECVKRIPWVFQESFKWVSRGCQGNCMLFEVVQMLICFWQYVSKWL